MTCVNRASCGVLSTVDPEPRRGPWLPAWIGAALLLLGPALAGVPLRAADGEANGTGPRRRPVIISPREGAYVGLFGIRAKGWKFVFVLDRSGSMGGSGGKALAMAKAELMAGLEGLDTLQQFQIVFYNERPQVFNPTGQPGRLAFGTEQNKRTARNFIQSIASDGGTAHEDAMVAAIRMRPDVIFLLTDADKPKLGPRELERIDRLGAGIMVHTIEFGTGLQAEADNFLVKLARQSGGEHVYVDVSKPRSPPKE